MWFRLTLSFLYSQRLPWSSGPWLLHLQNAKDKVICVPFKWCDNPTWGFLYVRKAICQLSHFTISVNYCISESWLAPNATNSTDSGIMFPLVISLAYKNSGKMCAPAVKLELRWDTAWSSDIILTNKCVCIPLMLICSLIISHRSLCCLVLKTMMAFSFWEYCYNLYLSIFELHLPTEKPKIPKCAYSI